MATISQLPSCLILFLLGTAVGSFLNVVSRRLVFEKRKKAKGLLALIKGRSRCESCGKTLKWYDLIPLFSFILLGGRCRYCKKRLSWQYPIVELGTGLLFVALAFSALSAISYQQLTIPSRITYYVSLLALLTASSSLIVIFITDLYKQLIFDPVVIIGIISAAIYRVLFHTFMGNPLSPIAYDLVLALAAAFLFWFLRRVTEGKGMGEGDAPLAFLVTLLPGCPLGLITLWLAFSSGALVGLILILLKRKKLKSRIAFGPFLVLSSFATLLFGNTILDWYLVFLGF